MAAENKSDLMEDKVLLARPQRRLKGYVTVTLLNA